MKGQLDGQNTSMDWMEHNMCTDGNSSWLTPEHYPGVKGVVITESPQVGYFIWILWLSLSSPVGGYSYQAVMEIGG